MASVKDHLDNGNGLHVSSFKDILFNKLLLLLLSKDSSVSVSFGFFNYSNSSVHVSM